MSIESPRILIVLQLLQAPWGIAFQPFSWKNKHWFWRICGLLPVTQSDLFFAMLQGSGF
jgi:hypothetical protein